MAKYVRINVIISRWLSSGLLRRVVWLKFTDVSEVLAASIIRAIITYAIKYKILTEIRPVNNSGKINTVFAFIFFSLVLSDSRALRWIEALFMGFEGKMVVMTLGSHQDSLHHHHSLFAFSLARVRFCSEDFG
jgi:hypothetical protein